MFDLKIPFNLTLCYEEFNSFTKLFEREREREREIERERERRRVSKVQLICPIQLSITF